MTPRRVRSVAFVASAVITASALSGCTPVSVTSGPAPSSTSHEWSSTEWWAFGDSLFAGHDSAPGAPSHLRGVLNASVGGTTLVPVTTFGNQNGDLVSQIAGAIERSGRPRRVVISSGMADLYARQFWGVDLPLSAYTDRYLDVTEWLRNLGIDVHWMTLTPITTWGLVGGQASMQAAINTWLRSSGLPIVDCESSLTAPGSPWLDDSLTFSLDGVHLNEAGASRYAACISTKLGIPLTSDPTDPEPTIPDTTVPDTTVPDTTVPDTTVPETPGP
jgi:lysophospholipase L1-like esterase